MKVKNIAFSGFAAAIFAASAANAAVTQIASKEYVDSVKGDTLTEVSEKYISNTELNTYIDNVLEDANSGLSQELSGKADKIEVSADKVGSIATVDANGQYQLGNVKEGDLVTNETITEKIAQALAEEGIVDSITKIIEEGDVINNVINNSLLDDNSDLSKALADKANAEDVYTKEETDAKIIELAIPQPTGACAADSNRCVLSVDATNNKLTWMDVTAPAGE